MNTKYKLFAGLGALVVVLIIVAVGYWYYQKTPELTEIDALEQAGNAAEKLGEQASQGVLPSIDITSNPMENSPDTNPVSKTNPFSGVKTNPFE